MKEFVLIFGPSAVGKMTVGYELARLTGLKLLHNHMTIELVLEFFDWDDERFGLSAEFRRRIFEEVAASDLPGLIFTFVWDLGDPREKDYVDGICRIFEDRGARTHFVELHATQSERLRRNESEFRLSRKPSKRDVRASRDRLLRADWDHVLNTEGGFHHPDRYLRIDNTDVSAADAARAIADRFDLVPRRVPKTPDPGR